MKLSLAALFILGELLFTIVAAFLIVLPSSATIEHVRRDYQNNYEYCYASNDAKKNQETKDCQSLIYKVMDDPTALFTGGLFVFTVTLAIATIGLFKVTKDGIEEQAKLTRESLSFAKTQFQTTERALIVPIKFNSFQLIDDHKRLIGYRMICECQNIGRSIATRFNASFNFVMLEPSNLASFDYADRTVIDDTNSFVGHGTVIPFPIDISLIDIDEIAAQRQTGLFYGWIDYEDFLKETRRTEVCVRLEVVADYRPIANGSGPSPIGVVSHGQYNGVDHDCRYKPGSRPPVGGLPPATQPPSFDRPPQKAE